MCITNQLALPEKCCKAQAGLRTFCRVHRWLTCEAVTRGNQEIICKILTIFIIDVLYNQLVSLNATSNLTIYNGEGRAIPSPVEL